jgi:hypothetical protein
LNDLLKPYPSRGCANPSSTIGHAFAKRTGNYSFLKSGAFVYEQHSCQAGPDDVVVLVEVE